LPGSLTREIDPPISAASREAMVRPSPVPPYLRVVEVSSCLNAEDERVLVRRDADAGVANREPELDLVARFVVSLHADRHLPWFPWSVNLDSRFYQMISTWRSRPASPITSSERLVDVTDQLQPL